MDKNQIEQKKKLWWLKELGLAVVNDSGVEWQCICCFCDDRDGHMHLNTEKLLYHCKLCHSQGAYITLMGHLAMQLASDLSEKHLRLLAANRKLPPEAFRAYGFGHTGNFYTLPVISPNGAIVNVGRYRLGKKLYNAPGCHAGLFGAENIADTARIDEPVYILEGPWDAIAFEWLRKKLNKQGVVTAVLGAGQLPEDYLTHFRNRDVLIAQDNDDAGFIGENRIAALLRHSVKSIKFYKWNDPVKGKDIRDIITGDLNEKST